MWIIRRLCDWMRRTHERIIRIPLFTTLFIVNNLSHTPNREGEKETQSTSLWSHFQSRIPLVLVSQAAIYQFVLIYGFIPKKRKWTIPIAILTDSGSRTLTLIAVLFPLPSYQIECTQDLFFLSVCIYANSMGTACFKVK